MYFNPVIFLACLSSAWASEYCRPLTNPLVSNCGSNRDAFLLKDVILSGPLSKGQPITVRFIGRLEEEISFGSKIAIQAKYDGTSVIDSHNDICDILKQGNTGYLCPIPPMAVDYNQTFVIPGDAPGGRFDITAYGYSQINRTIFKVKVQITFH